MAERLNAPALKTGVPKGTVGSNPTLTAGRLAERSIALGWKPRVLRGAQVRILHLPRYPGSRYTPAGCQGAWQVGGVV